MANRLDLCLALNFSLLQIHLAEEWKQICERDSQSLHLLSSAFGQRLDFPCKRLSTVLVGDQCGHMVFLNSRGGKHWQLLLLCNFTLYSRHGQLVSPLLQVANSIPKPPVCGFQLWIPSSWRCNVHLNTEDTRAGLPAASSGESAPELSFKCLGVTVVWLCPGLPVKSDLGQWSTVEPGERGEAKPGDLWAACLRFDLRSSRVFYFIVWGSEWGYTWNW